MSIKATKDLVDAYRIDGENESIDPKEQQDSREKPNPLWKRIWQSEFFSILSSILVFALIFWGGDLYLHRNDGKLEYYKAVAYVGWHNDIPVNSVVVLEWDYGSRYAHTAYFPGGLVCDSFDEFDAKNMEVRGYAGGDSIEFKLLDQTKESAVEAIAEEVFSESGEIVVSKNGDCFHYKDCPHAKQIKPENRIRFDSIAIAETFGYESCDDCNIW